MSRDAPIRRLLRDPARRPNRGGGARRGPSDDQVSALIEMSSSTMPAPKPDSVVGRIHATVASGWPCLYQVDHTCARLAEDVGCDGLAHYQPYHCPPWKTFPEVS
ncbi:hypothetical protein GW17_00046253 [Ensete ventricosum]|nr:hypothetical protein GW17_00046253 [Ensete ventricosum]